MKEFKQFNQKPQEQVIEDALFEEAEDSVKFDINVDRTKNKYLFQPPFTVALYANGRGGKSTFIKTVLMDPKYDIINSKIKPEDIYFLSPTVLDDDTYDDLFKHLETFPTFDKKRQVVEDVQKMDSFVRNIINENKVLKRQKIYKYPLFIADDLLGDIDLGNRSVFNQIATKGRHHLASMFIATQSHKGLGNGIRRNATHNAFWEFDNGDEIDSIVREVRGTMKRSQFTDLYLYAVRSKPHGFLFHSRLMPPQMKFSNSLENIIEL